MLINVPNCYDLEVVVGSDRVVRVNVDGICALRVRLRPEAEFRVTGAVELIKKEESNDQQPTN